MNKADRLARLLAKRRRRIIGLMSGMSQDGVDLACVDIAGEFPSLTVDLLGTHYLPYPAALRERLAAAATATAGEISRLNVLVARAFAECVRQFSASGWVDPASIDAIGSHGQTLFHATGAREVTPSTLQIGTPSLIAEETGLPTIGNFRPRDVAAGGQGAPLVSLADFVLFRDPSGPVALHNLGSISNLTVVTASLGDLLAFDTGPANMAIDFFARGAPGNPAGIDEDGTLSAQGECIPELLAELLRDPYFRGTPPKAAGYGEFGPARLAAASAPYRGRRTEDLLRTAAEFAAVTIGSAYREFVFPRYPGLRKSIFSGGGVYNATLMQRIRAELPGLRIEVLDRELADAKEAIAFALLANETLSGRPGSLPGATGAARAAVLGEIAP